MATTRVHEVDLLRFLAAMSVLLFHYAFRGVAADNMSTMPYPMLAPVAKYGYLGVELFFMISGFVILMTAARGSLKGFVISRLVRLYPAFWACCTITFVAICIMGSPRYTASVAQYLMNMTMLSGAVDVSPIDNVYWSLFVELRFYALVAAVLALKRIGQMELFLVAWIALSIALEVVPLPFLRYILIVDYSAFFCAGAMYFFIWTRGLSLVRAVVVASSWGLASYQSLEPLAAYESSYGTAMSGFVVVGLVTVFFVVMLLVALRQTGPIGRGRWAVAGALTYPLYLLHQKIGYMIFNHGYPTINRHVLFWGTVVLMLGMAYAVNVGVEKRFAPPMKEVLNRWADSLYQGVGRLTGRV